MTKKMTDKETIQEAVIAQDSMRTKRLYLYENQIKDISALSGLKNLENLYLSSNQFTDISALRKLIDNDCKIHI